jgi:hypothetical protein
MIVTNNKSFLDWSEIFHDQVLATAILDRLLRHATTLNIKGESYRLKEKRRPGILGRVSETKVEEEAAAVQNSGVPSLNPADSEKPCWEILNVPDRTNCAPIRCQLARSKSILPRGEQGRSHLTDGHSISSIERLDCAP